MTQEMLAEKLNISRSSIGMYENGEREPSLELLEKIADLFNVDMNYLLGTKDEEYFYDLKTRQMAQEIKDNKELYALFHASRNATKEDLEITKNLLLSLKRKERNDTHD